MYDYILPCEKCIETWNQEPSSWGDSTSELKAYAEHKKNHGRYTKWDIVSMINAAEAREYLQRQGIPSLAEPIKVEPPVYEWVEGNPVDKTRSV